MNCTPIVRHEMNLTVGGAFSTMAKYTNDRKLEAVLAYLDGVESHKDIAQKYQVSKTSLIEWVERYQKHGHQAFQKTYTNYSAEFKMDVLTYMNETGASANKVAAAFNIPAQSMIWKWKHLYETQGIDALKPKQKGRPTLKKKEKKKQLQSTEEVLQAKIEYLEMEIAYLKKLNALIQDREKSAKKTKSK